MLFRSRKPLDFWARWRTAMFPRRSYSRSFQYFKKRVLRLNATPHAIAAGIAAGAFASFTPFLGFHFFLAFAVAYLVAGNMVAAAIGTAVGNPITFPFIFGATYRTGRWILGGPPPHAEAATPAIHPHVLKLDFSTIWEPLLKPMAVGAVPLGLLCGFVLYVLTRLAVTQFRERRARRLAARAGKSGLRSGAASTPPNTA